MAVAEHIAHPLAHRPGESSVGRFRDVLRRLLHLELDACRSQHLGSAAQLPTE